MAERLTDRSAPPPPATPAALAELGARTFRDTFAADNTPENMALYLASSYGTDVQSAEIREPRSSPPSSPKSKGGSPALRSSGRPPPPECVDGARPIELWRFYVDRAWQGQGVAQSLMAATLAAAAARGADAIWLAVWERNTRAQAFYRKCGYVDRGAKAFMLGNDPQTDRVMARALPAEVGYRRSK